jgi:hypothetical protein
MAPGPGLSQAAKTPLRLFAADTAGLLVIVGVRGLAATRT